MICYLSSELIAFDVNLMAKSPFLTISVLELNFEVKGGRVSMKLELITC